MTTFKDYYAILKISENATAAEIKTAYKRQCMKWHPDHNLGLDTNSIMQALNEAKRILLNPSERERYNFEYAQYKKQEATQQPKQPYSKDEQIRRYKERYSKLKTRINTFRIKDPFQFEEFSRQIKMKNSSELLSHCVNWDCYQREYIDILIMELHEKRAYPIDGIYQRIKVKSCAPTNKNGTKDASYTWLWYVLWLVLSGFLSSLRR